MARELFIGEPARMEFKSAAYTIPHGKSPLSAPKNKSFPGLLDRITFPITPLSFEVKKKFGA